MTKKDIRPGCEPLSSLQEYIVIEEAKVPLGIIQTADLITAGGRLIMARNADEAEEVYVAEHGGSINDLVTFIAWRNDDDTAAE